MQPPPPGGAAAAATASAAALSSAPVRSSTRSGTAAEERRSRSTSADNVDEADEEEDAAPEVLHHLTKDPQNSRAIKDLGKLKKVALLMGALSHWDLRIGTPVRPKSTTTTTRIKSTIAELADEYKVSRDSAFKLYDNNCTKADGKGSDVWKTAKRRAATAQKPDVPGDDSGNAASSSARSAGSASAAASSMSPAALTASNAATVAGSMLGRLGTNQAAKDAARLAAKTITAAQKAARTAAEAALLPDLPNEDVNKAYLDKLASVMSDATKAAWKLAGDQAATSGRPKRELFVHPFSQGWLLPDMPQISDPSFDETFRRKLALPWAFNMDVATFHREPRVLPVCACGPRRRH